MIRFDTRDKKPKLYDLLPLTAIVAAAVLLLAREPANTRLVCWILGAYYGAVILRLLVAFRGQLQYNPYSYNTIIYSGFALFLLSVLITHIVLSGKMLRYPEVYTSREWLHLLLGSAKNYILLSSPFLLLFSGALCVSNVSLIRHEGKRLVNVLGIILSVLLVAGLVFIYAFGTQPLAAYRNASFSIQRLLQFTRFGYDELY